MSRRLSERIARVREYVTDESAFPIKIGDHYVSQLQSEIYDVDDRDVISVDIRLWCPDCNKQIITDTTIPKDDFETLRSLQWYSFAKFTMISCE